MAGPGRNGPDGGGGGPGYRVGLRVWGYIVGTSGSSPNGCNRFGVKNARAEKICGQKKRGSGQKTRGSGQKVHFCGQKAKFAGQKKMHNLYQLGMELGISIRRNALAAACRLVAADTAAYGNLWAKLMNDSRSRNSLLAL